MRIGTLPASARERISPSTPDGARFWAKTTRSTGRPDRKSSSTGRRPGRTVVSSCGGGRLRRSGTAPPSGAGRSVLDRDPELRQTVSDRVRASKRLLRTRFLAELEQQIDQ